MFKEHMYSYKPRFGFIPFFLACLRCVRLLARNVTSVTSNMHSLMPYHIEIQATGLLNVQQLANNLLASYRRHSLASFRSSVKTSRLNCQGDLEDFSEEKPFVNRIFAFWRVALGSVLSSVFGGAGGAPVSHRFASLGGRSLD